MGCRHTYWTHTCDHRRRRSTFGHDGPLTWSHANAELDARTGRHWRDGVASLGLLITRLRHAGPQTSSADVVGLKCQASYKHSHFTQWLYSTLSASMMFSRAARRAGGTEASRLIANAPIVKKSATGLGRKPTLKLMMSALTRLNSH